MGKRAYVLLGLLLLACPAGAATVASIDYKPVQPTTEIVGPMKITDLFVIPAVQRILYPASIAMTRHSIEYAPTIEATGNISLSPLIHAADDAAVISGVLIAKN